MQFNVYQWADHEVRCFSSSVGGRCSAPGASNIHTSLHKARYRRNASLNFSKKYRTTWNFHEHSNTCRIYLPSRRAQAIFHVRFASVWHLKGLWVSSPCICLPWILYLSRRRQRKQPREQEKLLNQGTWMWSQTSSIATWRNL